MRSPWGAQEGRQSKQSCWNLQKSDPSPSPAELSLPGLGPVLPEGLAKKDHLLERNMDAGQAKKQKQPPRMGNECAIMCGVWLFVCFLLTVRFLHSHHVCLHQAPSTVPILSSFCCPMNWVFLSFHFCRCRNQSAKREVTGPRPHMYLVSQLGSEPRSV